MKILSCTDYYSPHTGGVEIAAANLYHELAERGHEITIISLGTAESNHRNIEVKTAPKVDTTEYLGLQSSLSLDFPRVFLSLYCSGEYDLLHIHNRFFFTSTISSLLSGLSNMPMVFSLHTSSIDTYSGISGILARIFENTVCRWTIRKADHVICNSKATAGKAQSLGVNKKILSVYPHGVDTNEFSPNENSRPNHLSITYVGRLVKNKGVLSLPAIFRKVKENVPNATLNIVGDGPLKSEMEEQMTGFSSDITFYGGIPHTEVANVLQNSTIFCLPSKSEGLSLTTLEAMSTGLPVVVSDTGGLREIVQDGVTGYRIHSSHTMRFAHTIINHWQNENQQREMGDRARKYVIKNHSWEERAEAIESIFNQLLNQDNKESRL
jgi:glycosyltransferase involved in cell wall biosynthesis